MRWRWQGYHAVDKPSLQSWALVPGRLAPAEAPGPPNLDWYLSGPEASARILVLDDSKFLGIDQTPPTHVTTRMPRAVSL